MIKNLRKTILITAAGTATSVNIVKHLAAIDNLRIVTTDSNPAYLIAAPSRWHTTHYQVPPATERDTLIADLIRICEDELVDAIYPVHDAEILAVAEAHALFPDRVKLPALTPAIILNCNDKWMNFEMCRRAGLPVAETFLGTDLQRSAFEDDAELIQKPRWGVGSIGVRRITSFDELDAEVHLREDWIYQVPSLGAEFTIDVLNLNELFVAVVRERLETKSGVCTKARVFVDARLTALSRQVASVFGLKGLFCFQVMGDRRNQDFRIIDINPRCGGGTALTAAAGFPIYEAYFAELLGMDSSCDFKRICAEQMSFDRQSIVCRFFDEVVTQTS